MRDREDYGQIWQMVKILRILQYWMVLYIVQILHYILYNIPDYIIYLSDNPFTPLTIGLYIEHIAWVILVLHLHYNIDALLLWKGYG